MSIREWTILLPTFGMMLIFVAYIGHMLSMLILSPSLSSSALVNDGHARQIQETDCRSSGSVSPPRLHDIPPSLVNEILFGH